MKRFSALVLLTLPLSLVCSDAFAAPKIGVYPDHTRLVFTLPQKLSVKSQLEGQSLKVQLSAALPAEEGSLKAKGVSRYQIQGQTLTLNLASADLQPKVFTLAASGGQKARLVIDLFFKKGAALKPSSPQPSAIPPTPAKPKFTTSPELNKPRVVLDAGHGGIDPGMTSRWMREKEVTLAVALKVRKQLQAAGVEVIMTRDRDRHLSRDKRTDLELRSNMAVTGKVSAFISIHVNAGNSSAQGIETYYFGQPIGGQHRSVAVLENGGGSIGLALTKRAANTAQRLLGDILAQAKLSFSRDLARKVQARLVSATGAQNRGVHTDAFYVIRNPRTAAILTEIGFGSSPSEGARLADSAYQDKIAQSIAAAILDFLNVER